MRLFVAAVSFVFFSFQPSAQAYDSVQGVLFDFHIIEPHGLADLRRSDIPEVPSLVSRSQCFDDELTVDEWFARVCGGTEGACVLSASQIVVPEGCLFEPQTPSGQLRDIVIESSTLVEGEYDSDFGESSLWIRSKNFTLKGKMKAIAGGIFVHAEGEIQIQDQGGRGGEIEFPGGGYRKGGKVIEGVSLHAVGDILLEGKEILARAEKDEEGPPVEIVSHDGMVRFDSRVDLSSEDERMGFLRIASLKKNVEFLGKVTGTGASGGEVLVYAGGDGMNGKTVLRLSGEIQFTARDADVESPLLMAGVNEGEVLIESSARVVMETVGKSTDAPILTISGLTDRRADLNIEKGAVLKAVTQSTASDRDKLDGFITLGPFCEVKSAGKVSANGNSQEGYVQTFFRERFSLDSSAQFLSSGKKAYAHGLFCRGVLADGKNIFLPGNGSCLETPDYRASQFSPRLNSTPQNGAQTLFMNACPEKVVESDPEPVDPNPVPPLPVPQPSDDGSCAQSCDDGNHCTHDFCQKGTCQNIMISFDRIERASCSLHSSLDRLTRLEQILKQDRKYKRIRKKVRKQSRKLQKLVRKVDRALRKKTVNKRLKCRKKLIRNLVRATRLANHRSGKSLKRSEARKLHSFKIQKWTSFFERKESSTQELDGGAAILGEGGILSDLQDFSVDMHERMLKLEEVQCGD